MNLQPLLKHWFLAGYFKYFPSPLLLRTQLRISLCNYLNTLESVVLGSKWPNPQMNSFQEGFILAHGCKALCPQSVVSWFLGTWWGNQGSRVTETGCLSHSSEEGSSSRNRKSLWTRYSPQRITPVTPDRPHLLAFPGSPKIRLASV